MGRYDYLLEEDEEERKRLQQQQQKVGRYDYLLTPSQEAAQEQKKKTLWQNITEKGVGGVIADWLTPANKRQPPEVVEQNMQTMVERPLREAEMMETGVRELDRATGGLIDDMIVSIQGAARNDAEHEAETGYTETDFQKLLDESKPKSVWDTLNPVRAMKYSLLIDKEIIEHPTVYASLVQQAITPAYFGNQFTGNINKSVSDTFFGSSKLITEMWEKDLPKPVTGMEKAQATVGSVVGTVATYIAGGSVLRGVGLGKSAMPILWATYGQTSAPYYTTIEQRLQKAPVDLLAGWLFSKIPVPEQGKFFSWGTLGKSFESGALLQSSAFVDYLIMGLPAKEAYEVTKWLGLVGGLFYLGNSALVRATSPKFGVGTQKMSPDSIEKMVFEGGIENTPAGKRLLNISSNARASGVEVELTMGVKAPSPLAEKVGPEVLSKFGIKSETTLYIDAKPVTGIGKLRDKTPTIEDISAKSGGWKNNTDKARFDMAIMTGDKETVKGMLKDVPTEYMNTFAKEIEGVTGIKITPPTTDITAKGPEMAPQKPIGPPITPTAGVPKAPEIIKPEVPGTVEPTVPTEKPVVPKVFSKNVDKYVTAEDFAESIEGVTGVNDQVGLIDPNKVTPRDMDTVDRANVESLKQAIQRGDEIPPSIISTVDGKLETTEGTHRAIAYQELDQKMPVVYHGTETIDGLVKVGDLYDYLHKEKAPTVEKVEPIKSVKPTEITTAKEAAKDMIRVYVLRGETLSDLQKGQMGTSMPGGYAVQIGGYIDVGTKGKYVEKKIGSNQIVVTRIGGKEITPAIMPLKALYDEILTEKKAPVKAKEVTKVENNLLKGEQLKELWGSGKELVYGGKKYSIHKMSYGDYFLEPFGKELGETEGFAVGTVWLEKKNTENNLYGPTDDVIKKEIGDKKAPVVEKPTPRKITKTAQKKESVYRKPEVREKEVAKREAVVKEIESRREEAKPLGEDYRGVHEAPTRADGESSAPLNDVKGIYPDDIYGPNGAKYYGDGQPFDSESVATIQSFKGKPSARLPVYRAVPGTKTNAEMIAMYENQKRLILKNGKIPDKEMAQRFNLKDSSKYYDFIDNEIQLLQGKNDIKIDKYTINKGDWVTINRKYAVQHGESNLGGNYKIIKKIVRADEIFTDGNSVHEWGYDPKPITKITKTAQKAVKVSQSVPEVPVGEPTQLKGDEVINKYIYDKTGKILEKATKKEILDALQENPKESISYTPEIAKKFGKTLPSDVGALETRPVFLYGGGPEEVFTDGYYLILNKPFAKGVNDKLIQVEIDKDIKTLVKNAGQTFGEATKIAEENAKRAVEQTKGQYPKYKQLIPTDIGAFDNIVPIALGGGPMPMLAFRGSKGEIVAINPDYYQFLQNNLPKSVPMTTNPDDARSQVVFMTGNKIEAIVMPLQINDDFASRFSTNAPHIPQTSKEPIEIPDEKPTRYIAPSGQASSGASKIGDFEKVSINQTEEHNTKLYKKVQDLVHKYAKRIGEGYTPRNALGVFYPDTENLRVNGMNDLSVASHEITHFLDKAYDISSQIKGVTGYASNGNPIYDSSTRGIRKEITDLYVKYYPGGKKTHSLWKRSVEGFATLLQKYTEMPETVTKEFPNLVKEFLEEGGKFYHPIMGEIKQDLRDIVAEYQGLSALDKIGARVTSENANINKKDFLTIGEKIRTFVADSIYPLEVLAKRAGLGFTNKDPSLWVRFYNSSNQVFFNNINGNRGYWGWRSGEFKKIHEYNWKTLVDGLEKEKTTDSFSYYLVSRDQHFNWLELDKLEADYNQKMEILKQVGRDAMSAGTGKSALQEAQEAGKLFREEKAALDRNGFTRKEVTDAYTENKDRFVQEEEMYDSLVKEDIEFLSSEEVQLISPDKKAQLQSKQGYASLKRQFYDELVGDEEYLGVPKVGKTRLSSLIHRKGSARTIINPVYSGITNHAEATKKGLKQIVYNKIGGIAKSANFPELFQTLQLKAMPQKNGVISFPQEKDPHIIMTRQNYKRVPILVDNLMKQTIDDVLTHQNIGILEQLMLATSRFFTKGTTGLFPQFALSNYAVDQATAAAQTMNHYIPLYSPLNEMVKYFRNDGGEVGKYFTEYMVLGGERQTFVGWQDLSPNELFSKIRQEKNGLLKVMDGLNRGMDILAIPSKYSEIASRAVEYIKARESGKPQVVALEEAGRVTAPFHHIGAFGGGPKGVGARTYIKSIPFFNPAIQVLDQALRTVQSPNGRKRYAFVVMAITAALLGSFAILMQKGTKEQKDLYKNLEPNELSKYIWLPNPLKGDQLLRIRIPEQMGIIGVIANMALSDMMLDANYKALDYVEGATSFLPQQFDLTNPARAFFSWLPQIIKPAVMVTAGIKDFPRVMPLESTSLKYEEPRYRYTESTTAFAKFLGDKLNMSPIKIDYLVTGYAGRVSGFFTGKEGVYNPFSSVVRNYYFSSGRQISNFYDEKEKIDQAYKAVIPDKQGNVSREVSFPEKADIKRKKKEYQVISDLLGDYRKIDLEQEPEKAAQLREEILTKLNNLQDENQK